VDSSIKKKGNGIPQVGGIRISSQTIVVPLRFPLSYSMKCLGVKGKTDVSES
jgi:hypothetical protein